MSTEPNRQPPGTPKGGEFAAKNQESVNDDLTVGTQAHPPPLEPYDLKTQNAAVMSLLSYDRDDENLDFDAPYQRGHTWDEDRKRNLIRSVLTGIPMGAITLAEHPKREAKWQVVVDGKQRITALRDFHEDRLAVPGHWFTEADLKDPEMRSGEVHFSDLSRRGGMVFKEASVSIARLRPGNHHTKEEADQIEADLFLLINAGGIDQTEADLDRARQIARG